MNPFANRFDADPSEFVDSEYAHAYMDDFLNISIATQIKVLREQREWTQKELAREAKMQPARISVLENVNYSSWSINTLRRLAKAFDVTLRVSFETFGARIRDIEHFDRQSLECVAREKEFAHLQTAQNTSPTLDDSYYGRMSGQSNEPKKGALADVIPLNAYRRFFTKSKEQKPVSAVKAQLPLFPDESQTLRGSDEARYSAVSPLDLAVSNP